jgi:hypothetical protein
MADTDNPSKQPATEKPNRQEAQEAYAALMAAALIAKARAMLNERPTHD